MIVFSKSKNNVGFVQLRQQITADIIAVDYLTFEAPLSAKNGNAG